MAGCRLDRPAREDVLTLMLGVQAVLHRLEQGADLRHQALGPARCQGIADRVSRLGSRTGNALKRQILSSEPIDGGPTGFLEGFNPGLGGLQGRDRFRSPSEITVIMTQLARRQL